MTSTFEVRWHCERGEMSVEVVEVRESEHERNSVESVVVEFATDELAQLVEDGFIKLGSFHGYNGPRVGRAEADQSILDYCDEHGLF